MQIIIFILLIIIILLLSTKEEKDYVYNKEYSRKLNNGYFITVKCVDSDLVKIKLYKKEKLKFKEYYNCIDEICFTDNYNIKSIKNIFKLKHNV